MLFSKKEKYEFDYAYLKHNENDFGTAHISLQIGKDAFNLIIQVQDSINSFDLQRLLYDLQANELKKINIDIIIDCKVYLYIDNVKYELSLALKNQSFEVLDLIPQS